MKHSAQGHKLTEIIVETFKLSGQLVVEGDKLSVPLGLSSARWKVLGALARSDTPLTVSQIARHMGLSRQAVQTLVNALSEAKLIVFLDNPDHKRAKLVALSKEGDVVYSRIEEVQIPWVNACASQLPIEDLKTTLETLKKLSSLF